MPSGVESLQSRVLASEIQVVWHRPEDPQSVVWTRWATLAANLSGCVGYLRAIMGPNMGQTIGAITGIKSSVSSSIRLAICEGKRKPGMFLSLFGWFVGSGWSIVFMMPETFIQAE